MKLRMDIEFLQNHPNRKRNSLQYTYGRIGLNLDDSRRQMPCRGQFRPDHLYLSSALRDATMAAAADHPLHALAGLTVLVVGAERTGKTALIRSLATLAGAETPHSPSSPPPTPGPSGPVRHLPAVLALLLRSAPVRAARLRFGGAFRALRASRSQLPVVEASIPTGPDTPPAILIEASGGTARVRRALANRRVHCVLIVSRLDESRSHAADARSLELAARVVGPDAFDRSLVVFTHGHASPPHGLSFPQWVRGRRGAIWDALLRLVPPAPPGDAFRVRDPSAEDPAVANPPEEDAPIDRDVVWKWEHRMPWAREGGRQDGMKEAEAVQKLLADAGRADTAMSAREQFGEVDAANDEADDPVRNAGYRDPPMMDVVVVELSAACLVGENGEDGEPVLPDGSAWRPLLVNAIASRAVLDLAPAESSDIPNASENASPNASSATTANPLPPRPLRWLASATRWAWTDTRVVFLLQILVGKLLVSTIVAVHAHVMEAREKAPPKNLVIKLSDEEWEKRTRIDPEGGMFSIDVKGGQGGKAGKVQPSPSMREIEFGTLEEAEEEFFGVKRKGEGDGK